MVAVTSSDSLTPPTASVSCRRPVSRAMIPVPLRMAAIALSIVVTPATPGEGMSPSAGSASVTV